MEDKLKYKVISQLEVGVQPRDIAEDTGASYSSVLRVKNQFEQAKLNGTVSQLIDSDKLIIEQVGEQLGVDNVEKITKGLDGLEQLSTELQKTALALNSQVRSFLLSAEHPSELQVFADIICQLQSSFINKNMTQVNVQNNFGNSDAPKYTKFLGDKPGD